MTDLILPRRRFLSGLAAAFAAPAIVRVDSLMRLPPPIRNIDYAAAAKQILGGAFQDAFLTLTRTLPSDHDALRNDIRIKLIGNFQAKIGDAICIPTWGNGIVTKIEHG